MKSHFPLSFVAIFICCCIITACNNQKDEKSSANKFIYKSQYLIIANSEFLPNIHIKNPTDSCIDFRFSINNKFWFTPDAMLNYIKNLKSDSLPDTDILITNAFRFVVNNTGHESRVPMAKKHEFSPGIFINSIGYGLCSNRGAVLAILLQHLGFESRCVHLGSHLVTEVSDKNKWKMLDPDYNAYFLKDNKIASINELENTIDDCQLILGNKAMDYFIYMMPDFYKSLFTTKTDNVVDPWYKENIKWEENSFTLPPGAELSFPVNSPSSKDKKPYMFACLKLTKAFTGFINIPFVIHSTHGEGKMICPFESTYNSNIKFNFFAPGNYWVQTDSMEIYLYINPCLLYTKSDTMVLTITSSENNKLTVSSTPGNFNKTPDEFLQKQISLIKNKVSFYDTILKSDKQNFYDISPIQTQEDFVSAVSGFYKKTRNTDIIPDSIHYKIDFALTEIKKKDILLDEFFNKINEPFSRNILMIIIIDLPIEASIESFNYYSEKFENN